jgi:hypothetical protein
MNIDLFKTRAIAFAYEAGSLVAFAIISALSSPEFSALITEHFGETVYGGLILLVLNGIIKHIRNVMVVNAQIGGDNDTIVI